MGQCSADKAMVGGVAAPNSLFGRTGWVLDLQTPRYIAGVADGSPLDRSWTGRGKVRARALPGGGIEIAIDGVTTQARYYKPLVYEFFRKEMAIRPRYGDFSVSLRMEYAGSTPAMDLDNLCKALLDALKGFVFHDDSQIARLLAERAPGERDRIVVLAAPIDHQG
jgi:hypothetical protein